MPMFANNKQMIPSSNDVMLTLRALVQKDYIESNLIPAGVSAALAYALAGTFLDNKSLDEVGDIVEQLVAGTGVSVISDIMGQSMLGQFTAIGLPALSGVGRMVSDRLTADAADPTLPSAEAMTYAKLLFAAAIFAVVYVKPYRDSTN